MSADHNQQHQVIASAPGKVVLAGEYAVLTGAPAIVMAVNRRAHCLLASNPTSDWQFAATGFSGTSRHRLEQLSRPDTLEQSDPARLCAWLLTSADPAERARLPTGLTVNTNTEQMYHGTTKLGLGSSAALTTALAGALASITKARMPSFEAVHKAHQLSQGGVGSGLDIATSLAGGVIHFQAGKSHALSWPQDLHYRFVYAGLPASTTELVGRFNVWHTAAQKSDKIDALTALFDASATLANRAITLDNFARYIQALRALDAAATIGIYSPEHKSIATAAERSNVLYKPCGAGGGDLGVALSDNASDLDRFTAKIGNNFAVIDLEIASHGLTIG